MKLQSWPSDDVEVRILIDEEGKAVVKPNARHVLAGGRVRFKTDHTTGAEVYFPISTYVHEEGGQPGNDAITLKLETNDEQSVEAGDLKGEAFFSVFTTVGGNYGGVDQAPRIIIVKPIGVDS